MEPYEFDAWLEANRRRQPDAQTRFRSRSRSRSRSPRKPTSAEFYLHVEVDGKPIAPAPIWQRHKSAVPLTQRTVTIRSVEQPDSDEFRFVLLEPEPIRYFDVDSSRLRTLRLVVSTHLQQQFPCAEPAPDGGRGVLASLRMTADALQHCLHRAPLQTNCALQHAHIQIRMRPWREPGLVRIWFVRCLVPQVALRQWREERSLHRVRMALVFESFRSRFDPYASRSGTLLLNVHGTVTATQQEALTWLEYFDSRGV